METDSKKCTVFGASKPLPGSQEYQEAERLGTLLASHGISIVCGGYFGTMEAVCKGARSVNNPRVSTEGVVVPSVFLDRPRDGNSYLSTCTHAESLIKRMDRMINSFCCQDWSAHSLNSSHYGTKTIANKLGVRMQNDFWSSAGVNRGRRF